MRFQTAVKKLQKLDLDRDRYIRVRFITCEVLCVMALTVSYEWSNRVTQFEDLIVHKRYLFFIFIVHALQKVKKGKVKIGKKWKKWNVYDIWKIYMTLNLMA